MKGILVIIFVLLPLLGHSQGFLRPVELDIFTDGEKGLKTHVWQSRPLVNINAIQIMLGGEPEVRTLNSLGVGWSYACFTEAEGEPYQIIAADLSVLFGTDLQEPQKLELSVALGATLWQYLSLGAGYNFMEKRAFILTGISYRFN